MKPNPYLYAFEVTRDALVTGGSVGLAGGIPSILLVINSERALLTTVVALLITFVLLGLALFIVAFATACCLTFVVTEKSAIVRFSSSAMTTDDLSIAIESVERIEIKSYGATYGSVYLTYDKTSPHENSNEARAYVPIERINSVWGSMSTWPLWFGFYGFMGFDEFANIISEQQNAVDRRSPVDIG
jgi:hypothetical protein